MEPPREILLFQYGSNMHRERLAAKIEQYAARRGVQGVSTEVRYVGLGRLDGWRFMFDLYSTGQDCRVADIVESPGGTVWGAAYALDRELVFRADGERSVLDLIEGYRTERAPENYVPVAVTVVIDGTARSAITYVGTDESRTRARLQHSRAPVRQDYVDAIMRGAASIGAPVEYLDTISRAIEESRHAEADSH
jgi:cation transport regulator ChaC